MNAPMPGASLGRRPCLAAMLVEMIHVASLIHDDVIDESDTRRGKPSVNARWQSHKAVILGDYILARNMNLGLQSGQYDLVTHICGAMSALCEGEVLQGDCAEKHVMTRKSYLDIVHKKTASLIGVSASSGALAVGATRDKVARMRHFGESLGMAFQIQDDILDIPPPPARASPPTTTCARARLRCRSSACWSVWARSGRPRSSHGSSAVTRTPPPWNTSNARRERGRHHFGHQHHAQLPFAGHRTPLRIRAVRVQDGHDRPLRLRRRARPVAKIPNSQTTR